MKSLGTEFKVGVFTLVAALIIGYMFFVLSPETFKEQKFKTYYTVLIDAAGIVPKSQVKTNGVIVGKVLEVKLETNRTRVVMAVDNNVKVPMGSYIEVRTRGLLGDVFIEIIRANDTGQYIEDGGYIPRSEDDIGMQQLISLVGSIGKDVKKVTATLANVLGSEQGERDVGEIVTNLREITKNANGILMENRSQLHTLIANLEKTSDSLRKAIGDNDQDMVAIVKDLKTFTSGLRELMNDSNRARYDRILANVDESLADFRGTSKNIKLVAEKIERGEGTLGKLVNEDKALVEIEGAVKDLREVLSPATKLNIFVDYHGELRHDDTTQHYFNLGFQTRPDKYFLLGFTDYENRTIRKTTETVKETPADGEKGPTVTTEETIKEDKALRFNLQFAKRWYFVAARFGLFETTGGLASDLYFFRDRFRFSFEAFDWKTKDNPIRRVAHLKSYASILFFNHIYAMAGVDDITRLDQDTGKTEKTPNYFFGAGLSFNDRDLKAIVGTAAATLAL